MANHASHMLDSMMTAVDEGFSYDGIVSVPEAGLEDAEFRSGPGMASSLRDGVARSSAQLTVRVRKTGEAISRGAARVLNQGQRRRSLSPPASWSTFYEKNGSEVSFTLSDEPSGGLAEGRDEDASVSSAAHAEAGGHIVSTRECPGAQPHRASSPGDDETDIPACGCLGGFLSPDAAFSETNSAEDVRPSRHGRRKLRKKGVGEKWQVMTVIVTSQEELPGKTTEEEVVQSTVALQEGGSPNVQLSDLDQESLPGENENEKNVSREDGVVVPQEKLPGNEEEVGYASIMDQEKQPRKKLGK